MRIVFATAEVSPIAQTGGLGDVCGSLPKEVVKLGHDVTIFLPFYRQAREYFEKEGVKPEPLLADTISWANWSAEALYLSTTLPGTDIPLILIGNDYFYDRDQIYSAGAGLDDSLLRYVFFCRALIHGCEYFDIAPDILHCHDWHTALLPVYLHSGLRSSPQFQSTRSVFTIHNLNYQGASAPETFAVTGLHGRYWAPDALEHFGTLNPMKGGIIFADEVTTVSPNYGREIQTPPYGAGLDGVLRILSYKLTGILNGIDADQWNPATDPHLEANYDMEQLEGKAVSKRALAREAGLRYKARTPVLGVVSRLVEQKGFQLLIPILSKLLEAGAQAVILGSGERWFEEGFERIARDHKESCHAWIGFDNALAHRIYAGCDLLLMPSIYEPCGLNQMYSMRYGALPVARLTGGLADTVIPFDGTNKTTATGFGFFSPSSEDLYFATWAAMLIYKDVRLWSTVQHNGMSIDFSWAKSAREYDEVYKRAAGV